VAGRDNGHLSLGTAGAANVLRLRLCESGADWVVLVAAVVLATGASYPVYFAGAQFINSLLGPATIALAIPLAKNLTYVRSNLRSIGLALLAGSVTSIVSGIAIVCLLGGSRIVALSMAPKG
jgi:putative effector of murein hydrolase